MTYNPEPPSLDKPEARRDVESVGFTIDAGADAGFNYGRNNA